MRILISTTIRNVLASERSGYLYTVDFSHKKVLRRSVIVEPPFRDVDENPRGGMRGSKGVAIRPDMVGISNSSSIFLFDSDWKFIRTITHPSCAGIHGISFQEDTIWASAARSDMIFQFDFYGNLLDYLYFREFSSLRKKLHWYPPIKLSKEQVFSGFIDFRDPRNYEKESYDNAHTNSVCQLDNGNLLVSLGLVLEKDFLNLVRVKKWLRKKNIWNRFLSLNRMLRDTLRLPGKMHSDLILQPVMGRSAIVSVSKNKNVKLLFTLEKQTVPGHSPLRTSEKKAVFLDTTHGKIIEFNLTDGKILYTTKVTNGFLRGSALASENSLILGSGKEIILFDLARREIQERMKYTDTEQEFVFDIQVLPPKYTLPPFDFNEIINPDSKNSNIIG